MRLCCCTTMAVQRATESCAVAVAGTIVTEAPSSLFLLHFYASFRCNRPWPAEPYTLFSTCQTLASTDQQALLRCCCCHGVVMVMLCHTLTARYCKKFLYSAHMGSPPVLLCVLLILYNMTFVSHFAHNMFNMIPIRPD